MRTVSIIQPSFLPWRGYFAIIEASDIFVFYDDVQYDRRGWRNRNKIKTANGTQWISVPVQSKGNYHQKIRDVKICHETPWQKKLLTALRCSYGKSPYFDEYYDWLEKRLGEDWEFLVDLDIALTKDICGFLGIEVAFARSSELPVAKDSNRIDRLVDICRFFKAERYLSGPSAHDYIGSSDAFSKEAIDLKYASYAFEPYRQLFGDYVAEVSTIDLLFNHGKDARRFLEGLSLLPSDAMPRIESPSLTQ